MTLTPEQRSEIMLTNIDTSDCGVIALQAITGMPRDSAVVALEAQGYSPAKGTPRGALENVLSKTHRCEMIPFAGHRETPATFASRHEDGKYLLYTRRHVMALVEGDLHNSIGNWNVPLDAVIRIKERNE